LCIALGFWVAAVRVYDWAAWNLLLLMLSVANLTVEGRTIYGNEDWLQPFLTAFSIGLIRLGPIVLAYFGITFPQPLAFDRNHPWVKWILLGPMLVRVVFLALPSGLFLHHQAIAVALQPTANVISKPGPYLELIAIAVFFLSLFYKTVTAVNPDARRRLLLLDTAAVLGLLPFLMVIIVCSARGIPFQGWYAAGSMAMLFVFPVTMAYVIVVDRAMDVRVVVRQGVQYLLATGSIRVLQVVISIAIIVVAASMSANTVFRSASPSSPQVFCCSPGSADSRDGCATGSTGASFAKRTRRMRSSPTSRLKCGPWRKPGHCWRLSVSRRCTWEGDMAQTFFFAGSLALSLQ
jgi:sigma-B regulation protein RsbU (phosphoserine phosphatase)